MTRISVPVVRGWYVAILLILTCGCAVVHAPVKAYHFLYCDQMGADGKCERWATPCGKLECKD